MGDGGGDLVNFGVLSGDGFANLCKFAIYGGGINRGMLVGEESRDSGFCDILDRRRVEELF